MPIVATATAYPPYYFSQQEVLDAPKRYWEQGVENVAVLERLHSRTGVGGRYFSRPLEEYAGLDTWGKANDVWIPGLSGPRVLGSACSFCPDTQDVMGWKVSERGFELVLSPDVPKVVKENLGRDVDAFLARHGMTRKQVGSWIMHTGGPKVLDATAEALDLENGDLQVSREILERVGNLSSASVLVMLDEVLTNRRPAPGTRSILAAMGPGFCSEMLLLEW